MNLFHPADAARAALAGTKMRAADYRPERRRTQKWPRLLARFNYRERQPLKVLAKQEGWPVS